MAGFSRSPSSALSYPRHLCVTAFASLQPCHAPYISTKRKTGDVFDGLSFDFAMDVLSQSIPARSTMNEQGPRTASSQPFNRACDACRAHKVRCLPNPAGSSKTCQRCMRTDRQCIFTAPQKRKQRKRTDTRVAELEREVQAMRALFDRKPDIIEEEPADFEEQPSKPNASRSTATTSAVSSEFIGSGSSPGSKSPHDDHTPRDWSPPAFSPHTDVVEREILTMEEANQLFQSYNNDLTQYYPTVVFPPEVSAADLRRTKPTLFLAVISAAAAKVDPHLYSILNTEVLSSYAHRTVVKSEKSLELVQAIIITTVWYFPPGKYAKLKFYEYIHMVRLRKKIIFVVLSLKRFLLEVGAAEEIAAACLRLQVWKLVDQSSSPRSFVKK